MARGFLPRGVRIVAAGVVLHHSSPKCQVGSCPHLSLGPSTTTDVMDQQGAELGSSQGRANTAEPYPRSLRGRFQSGYGNASYAGSSSPALQTPTPLHVGIQPGRTAHYLEFPRHDARGDVQIVLQTPNRVSGHYRGRRPKLQPPRCLSKLSHGRTHYPFIYHDIILKNRSLTRTG